METFRIEVDGHPALVMATDYLSSAPIVVHRAWARRQREHPMVSTRSDSDYSGASLDGNDGHQFCHLMAVVVVVGCIALSAWCGMAFYFWWDGRLGTRSRLMGMAEFRRRLIFLKTNLSPAERQSLCGA